MRVKICGIKRLEDALCACEYGADAVGFIFYKKSVRYITPESCTELIAKLPPFVERVGVFVEESAEEIDAIVRACNLSLAQVFPDKVDTMKLKSKHLKVIRVQKQEDMLAYSDEYRLIDAHVEQYGGEGKRLNLEWFEGVDRSKMILAGGLNTDNIDELADSGFYGVDISSGVESAKGVKDRERIKTFLTKAKNL